MQPISYFYTKININESSKDRLKQTCCLEEGSNLCRYNRVPQLVRAFLLIAGFLVFLLKIGVTLT